MLLGFQCITHPKTQHRISKDQNRELHGYERLKARSTSTQLKHVIINYIDWRESRRVVIIISSTQATLIDETEKTIMSS